MLGVPPHNSLRKASCLEQSTNFANFGFYLDIRGLRESPEGLRRQSDRNPLNLVEADLISRAVVELRRPWRLMRRDLLRVLRGAAVLAQPAEPPSESANGGGGDNGGGRGVGDGGEFHARAVVVAALGALVS